MPICMNFLKSSYTGYHFNSKKSSKKFIQTDILFSFYHFNQCTNCTIDVKRNQCKNTEVPEDEPG